MALKDTLARLPEQFDWQPELVHPEVLRPHKHYIVCGMGGSHLGAWLIKQFAPMPNLTIHRDYGLPDIAHEMYDDALVILSSYSGTTEEVLDSARVALEHGLPMAAISTGGKLIEFAREHAIPHIVIPETGLEPRLAIGFAALGIARLMQNASLEDAIRTGGRLLDVSGAEAGGTALGSRLLGKVPLIYASNTNLPIAFIWKIKCNENAKIPAFCNVFPEMCHNELTGFDAVESTRPLIGTFHAIFLEDPVDHPRVQKRMQVAREMLEERGVAVDVVPLDQEGFAKAFRSAVFCDWATIVLADQYGVPNPETPMVAEFKHRIGQ